MFLIGCVSGLIARPRQPHGALSARFVSTAPASDRRGRRESVRTGRRGGGMDGRALGRQVEVDVHLQSSTGRPKTLELELGWALSFNHKMVV